MNSFIPMAINAANSLGGVDSPRFGTVVHFVDEKMPAYTRLNRYNNRRVNQYRKDSNYPILDDYIPSPVAIDACDVFQKTVPYIKAGALFAESNILSCVGDVSSKLSTPICGAMTSYDTSHQYSGAGYLDIITVGFQGLFNRLFAACKTQIGSRKHLSDNVVHLFIDYTYAGSGFLVHAKYEAGHNLMTPFLSYPAGSTIQASLLGITGGVLPLTNNADGENFFFVSMLNPNSVDMCMAFALLERACYETPSNVLPNSASSFECIAPDCFPQGNRIFGSWYDIVESHVPNGLICLNPYPRMLNFNPGSYGTNQAKNVNAAIPRVSNNDVSDDTFSTVYNFVERFRATHRRKTLALSFLSNLMLREGNRGTIPLKDGDSVYDAPTYILGCLRAYYSSIKNGIVVGKDGFFGRSGNTANLESYSIYQSHTSRLNELSTLLSNGFSYLAAFQQATQINLIHACGLLQFTNDHWFKAMAFNAENTVSSSDTYWRDSLKYQPMWVSTMNDSLETMLSSLKVGVTQLKMLDELHAYTKYDDKPPPVSLPKVDLVDGRGACPVCGTIFQIGDTTVTPLEPGVTVTLNDCPFGIRDDTNTKVCPLGAIADHLHSMMRLSTEALDIDHSLNNEVRLSSIVIANLLVDTRDISMELRNILTSLQLDLDNVRDILINLGAVVDSVKGLERVLTLIDNMEALQIKTTQVVERVENEVLARPAIGPFIAASLTGALLGEVIK